MKRRQERGTALVEFTWLGILLLVPLIYIVVSVFEVQRASYGVSTASRSAARAFSLAPTAAEGEARARAAVRTALQDQGLDGHHFDLQITCAPACLQPGSTVTVQHQDECRPAAAARLARRQQAELPSRLHPTSALRHLPRGSRWMRCRMSVGE